MSLNKEKNFVSAVVYLYNEENSVKKFLTSLNELLKTNFEKYEIICVNDTSTDNTAKAVEEFCDETGMNVSVAINMFVKAVLRENRLPFDVKTEDPFYSDENMARLRKSIEQIEKTGGTLHEVPEV